jgi:hypothetical protein
MTPPVTAGETNDVDLTQYDNKKIKLIRNLSEANDKGELAVEVEGTVQVGNEHGLLIKPKGQVAFQLIPASEIEPGSISLVEGASSKIKRSSVLPLKVGQARRHLLNTHGYKLEWVNGLTEEQAMEFHGTIDHVENDLGHVHDKKAEDKKDKDSDES